jgi:phytoene dehydrogenase-like protein
MKQKIDTIVIGGGHNGLTTACLLAMAGKRVTLVERRDAPGGLASAVEFEPGFRSGGAWHDPGCIAPAAIGALGLERLVDESPEPIYALGEGGACAPLAGPADTTAFGIAQHSQADARQYARYRQFLQRIRPVVERFLTHRPLRLLDVENEAPMELVSRALGLRMLGARDMVELLRVAPMPVADFLNQYFETDFFKAAMALGTLLGTFTAPRSPGTTMNLLLNSALAGPSLRGGNTALTEALVGRARDLGVEFVTGNGVREILITGKAVKGAELDDGEVLESASIAASCNPKSVLLDLLPVGVLTHTSEHRIANFRTSGTAAQLLLAVDGPVRFIATPAEVGRARIAPSLDHVEKAFDAVKYGACSAEPVLDVAVPSLADPALAPKGKSVVSVLIAYVPRDPDGGWSEAAKESLTAQVIETVARHATGLESKVLAARLTTPADFEDAYRLPGGHLHHGEPGIDQLLIRPIPECQEYNTPIAGLTLCGSGSHPGGIVSCMAGTLAAQAMLRVGSRRAAESA